MERGGGQKIEKNVEIKPIFASKQTVLEANKLTSMQIEHVK